MTKSVFIVAAERSGDDLGAGLISELKQCAPELEISGIGGPAMAAAGVSSDYDISPLSILGFTEAIKSYLAVVKKVREAVDLIMKTPSQAVVLIDSWGFMLRVAWGLRKAGYEGEIIKYVAPQVWAMREGRSKVLAKAVDHLLTIHSFDAPYFERHGLPVHYVGNPVFDTDYASGNGSALRDKYNIAANAPVLALLLGSRPSEITRLAEPMAETLSRLKKSIPDLVVVSPVSGSVLDLVNTARSQHAGFKDVIFIGETEKLDCFAAAGAALACSGTVTTQLADAGVPTVVTYKLSGLTFAVAKRLFRPDYISIVNIAADEALMPEFVQRDCNAQTLADAVKPYLTNPEVREQASKALKAQTAIMRGAGGRASRRAAEAVLDILAD